MRYNYFIKTYIAIYLIIFTFIQIQCKPSNEPFLSNEQIAIIGLLRSAGFQGRFNHASVKLADGKRVLFCGGTNGMGFIYKSCYIFSEDTGKILKISDLNIERTTFTMHLLNSGKVLVAGGVGSNDSFIVTSEIFDPMTESFSVGPKLNSGRIYFASTKLNNGKILFSGGVGLNGQILKTLEIYDPALNLFSNSANQMTTERFYHTATTLVSGNVLIAGGSNKTSRLSSAEIYDPVGDSLTVTGNLNHPRSRHSAALLGNGNVLITAGRGGQDSDSNVYYEEFGEVYAGATFSLTAGKMNFPRRSQAIRTLLNGDILICGGYVLRADSSISDTTNSCEKYNVVSNTYSSLLNLSVPRANPVIEVLNNGKIFIFGGILMDGFFANDVTTDNTGEIIDLQSNTTARITL
ncbi:Kelch repeat-containing protein [Leptospira sanjuanensis]|uniref:Kelch repeat-containing protein n=1 Tax=Leptospira sanjuanensis TaxID=2879643 RepID=UPI001EE8E2DF|nr:kelch repeat-containing protein [Leptospira sanjuanensis]MCG6167540.1 galactose oxidase [Leptospira sanjuanensis]